MVPVNVEGFRRAARRRLPKPLFDFVDGGAEDEVTERANRRQFELLRFAPRILTDVSDRSLSCEVAGVRLRLPIIFAPTGLVGLVHPDGERAAATVAARQSLLAVVSGHATYALEEVADAAPGSRRWFDMFPWGERALYGQLIDRAAAAGYGGLCVTIDTTVPSNRERDWVNGWTAPPRLTANFFDYATRPAWVLQALQHRRGTLKNFQPEAPSLRTFISQSAGSARGVINRINPKFSWDDLDWIRSKWEGQLALKGAFVPEDARRLADAGVNVLFVGNHGGRQLDGLQTGLEQLPALVSAVGDRVDLVLDGGVRRGSDIIKAICLGAKACMIGRAWVFGLSYGGTPGVEAVIQVLEREMDMVLGLLGVSSIRELDASYVTRAQYVEDVLQAVAPDLAEETNR